MTFMSLRKTNPAPSSISSKTTLSYTFDYKLHKCIHIDHNCDEAHKSIISSITCLCMFGETDTTDFADKQRSLHGLNITKI